MARRRRAWAPLATIVVVTAAALTTVLVEGWSPRLGLDLQGGASVVYEAADPVPSDTLDDAIEIIRSRVDALGVAEPEIVRQGDAIVVNLPGIDDRDRALEVIGRTAELRFRPVLGTQPYLDTEALAAATSTTLPPDGTTSTTAPVDGSPTSTAPVDVSTTAPVAPSTTATQPAPAPPTSEGALGTGIVEGENAGALLPTDDIPVPPTVPGDPTATTVPLEDADFSDPCVLLGGTTPEEEDLPDQTVVLPGKAVEGEQRLCYQLGPVPTDGERELVGRIVTDPQAQIQQGEWGVSLGIRGGDLPLFNQTAALCFQADPSCPTRQLAIVLDEQVQSAPTINEPTFDDTGLVISGSFREREARDLALVLRFGALPVELVPQTVQEVSATLGQDSLNAGLVAGAIGVALVILYMLLYYRALGAVVLLGLAVWSGINFSVISWLGETQGLALSLAGVTGIVVSVGVTVDSYVVYFERLKDEIRSGKTIRSSVDRGFQRAFRTILTADVSSFIGAFLLYVLTVGPVRGFAFFLGLATILDVIVAYFFTRPLVAMLGRSDFFTRSRMFGVARGATPAPAAEAA